MKYIIEVDEFKARCEIVRILCGALLAKAQGSKQMELEQFMRDCENIMVTCTLVISAPESQTTKKFVQETTKTMTILERDFAILTENAKFHKLMIVADAEPAKPEEPPSQAPEGHGL